MLRFIGGVSLKALKVRGHSLCTCLTTPLCSQTPWNETTYAATWLPFFAWDASLCLPVTPAQLLRRGIALNLSGAVDDSIYIYSIQAYLYTGRCGFALHLK